MNHLTLPYDRCLASTVKDRLRLGHCDIDPDSLVITQNPEYLGSGVWGDVYKIHDRDGVPYALKLIHSAKRMEITPDFRERIANRLLQGAWEHRDILTGHEAFTNLYGVSFHKVEKCSLAEFAEGQNVRKAIEEGVDYSKTPEKAGRMLMQVAKAIKYLHARDYLIFDVGWYNTIEHKGNVRFCDNDAIEPKGDNPKSGDIEGFAHMIDEIFNGGKIAKLEKYNRYAAVSQEHGREYPWTRRQQLPSELSLIVPEILHKKRNDTLTIDTFIYAIARDFGLQAR